MLLAFRIDKQTKDKLIGIKDRKNFKDFSKAIRYCIEYTEVNTRG